MKKLLSVIWIAIALLCFSLATPALAGDAAKGKQIFVAECAACHKGGKNLVKDSKTLKKEDLEKYDRYSLDKIVYQITNGKDPMPGFKGHLKPDQIEDVATYVLEQAEKGW
ncbi:MAG: c-type cytochrome [Symploca sp. SIO1A3]|nr:c-type cytochrome [Symploca sp. SIO2C1]NER50750.1 c-type cytochrome [Symploca sp. SIO1A3]